MTDKSDLTKQEIAFLAGENSPPEIAAYVDDGGAENVGVKISAYRKVTAAARAEAEALLAVQDLADIHGELAQLADAKKRILILEARTQTLELDGMARTRELSRQSAAGAMAVAGD